jgi:capsular exopolysaccharide synthesis family protein
MENTAQPDFLPEKNIKDYFEVLVRRRWVIIAFFAICATVVTLGTFLMTPLYRSETKLIIEGENSNVRSAEEAASAGSSIDVFESYLATQIALIKSDAIAGKIYSEFNLKKNPRYKKRVGLAKIFQKNFAKDIYIEQVKGSRMIIIAVENPDPELAKNITNRLAEVYAKDNLMRRAMVFIRNQRMASLNDEFLRLQSKLDSLSNRFGPKHPEMIALRNEIRTMARRIESERAKEKDVMETIPVEDQALLEDTLHKIQESSVFSSSRMNNIGVVDYAYAAQTPIKPKIVMNIILGVLAGIFGGIVLAFLADYLDDTIKTDEDLKRNIGKTAFLGSIFAERSSVNTKEMDRLVALRMDSPAVEAYRLVRMNILWFAKRENALKDFAVVSPGPGEGKTTLASNLALVLAQANQKVLFVDTDFRRGRLHEIYDFMNDKGLGEYLTDGAGLDQVVRKTETPNLSVVTCGKSVIDSAKLLASNRMTEFIKETRKQYDMIIYDTPPVTIISDTSILISQLDGCLLGIRCGFTTARVLSHALTLIRESKTRMIGVVLNGVVMNNSASYNRYYKKYYNKVSVRRT